ncbi:MAG TPA: LysR family transcriptional regulator, partial [Conexibacter sp.]|nr:LysR family transcriptional regulator [Conexibacter sp.]
MELRQLACFVAVAEELSFTRAARRLHLVQSGVSASVRALERELDAELFERTTQRVALTGAGAALLPEARVALAAAQRAADAVARARGTVAGTLTIGTVQSAAPLDLPAVLARFHAEHPG